MFLQTHSCVGSTLICIYMGVPLFEESPRWWESKANQKKNQPFGGSRYLSQIHVSTHYINSPCAVCVFVHVGCMKPCEALGNCLAGGVSSMCETPTQPTSPGSRLRSSVATSFLRCWKESRHKVDCAREWSNYMTHSIW